MHILRARSTRVLQYHHFMILVIFASSNLDGDSASPYPRFPAIFSKNRNGILASQGNFKIVYISCGDEVRDYVFEKILKKYCMQFAPSGGRKCVFQRPLCGAERPLVFS